MSKKFVKLTSPAGTHPLIWCVAVACTVLTVLVIVTGIVVFIGYLAIKPKVPFVVVSYAQLDTFKFDRSGLLTTKLAFDIKAENDNTDHVSFSDFRYTLKFDGIKVALLQAMSFDVPKNSTVSLNYVVEASPIPLDSGQMKYAQAALDRNRIRFDLVGRARVRWKAGLAGSVKFWCRLNCHFQFEKEGDVVTSHCNSKS